MLDQLPDLLSTMSSLRDHNWQLLVTYSPDLLFQSCTKTATTLFCNMLAPSHPLGQWGKKWLPTITNFSSCENYWAVGVITQILSWLSKRWKEKAPTKQLFYILNKNFISKDAPTHLLHWNTSPLQNRKCTEIIVEYFQFYSKESESGWVFVFETNVLTESWLCLNF